MNNDSEIAMQQTLIIWKVEEGEREVQHKRSFIILIDIF